MARTTARVDGATLVLAVSDASPIIVDTPAWFAWLEQSTTFAFTSPAGRFTAREMTQIASRPDQPLLLEGPAYYAGMGDLLREWNDFDAAEQHLAHAMEQLVGRLVVDAEDVALGYLALARLQHARRPRHRTSGAGNLHRLGPPARLCDPPDRTRCCGAGAAGAGAG